MLPTAIAAEGIAVVKRLKETENGDDGEDFRTLSVERRHDFGKTGIAVAFRFRGHLEEAAPSIAVTFAHAAAPGGAVKNLIASPTQTAPAIAH
jgi:hypothetical protein